MKILIVEDEQMLREAFEFLLKAEGFKVKTARNGEIALDRLKEFKPDLILLDMLMPVMNGVEFLHAASIREKYPTTQVIMLSNLSDTIALDEAPKYNVTERLIKANLSPTELVEVIKKRLKKRKV